MRTYTFTGPEHVDPAITRPLRERLVGLPKPRLVITGAAKGVDTIACRLALEVWPKAKHLLLVPNFRHNETLVMEMEDRIEIEYMPKNTGPLERNVRMVEPASHLIAVPLKATWYRSGTWHTINTARRRRVSLIMYPVPVLLGTHAV